MLVFCTLQPLLLTQLVELCLCRRELRVALAHESFQLGDLAAQSLSLTRELVDLTLAMYNLIVMLLYLLF